MGFFLGVILGVGFISNMTFAFENPVWGVQPLMAEEAGQPPGKNKELLESLFLSASQNHHVLGYNRARQVLLGQVYLQKNGNDYSVHDVYCQKDFTNRDFRGGANLGPDQIPDGSVLNTEHTWPQSRFNEAFPGEMQKSDLHHLFPTDSEMNSTRGNHKFAELGEPTMQVKCSESRFAYTSIGYRFEPPMVHRGNVARALFYFSVRYKIHIDNDEEAFLRKWHYQDPVDQDDVKHHEMIYQKQGNRNPFIDHPELVGQITDF